MVKAFGCNPKNRGSSPLHWSTMKTIIHVNQHNIKYNKKNTVRKPVLTVKTYKTNSYADSVSIVVPGLGEVAKITYSPDKPLSCGATCWISTEYEVIPS